MIYLTTTISIAIFLGLTLAKFAYYISIPDIIILISMVIAFFLSGLAVADIVSEFINNLIEKK